ncbi:hypothetical protein CIB84_003719, partial [Bambusicola thoracicus]
VLVLNFASCSLCFSQKSSASQKADWKDSKCKEQREEERAYLAKLEKRQNFLKNPRFFPPNTLHGGKSLVMSQGQVEQIISRTSAECNTGDTSFVPVFLANPPTVFFSDYEVGRVYEVRTSLQGVCLATGKHFVLP